jgi:tight adherence protein C
VTLIVPLIVAALIVVAAGIARRELGRSTRRPLTARSQVDTAPARRSRRSAGGRALGRHRSLLTIGAIASAGALVLGPLVVFIGAGCCILLRRLGPLLAARRRRVLIDRAVPDAIELFVLSAQAGLTPVQAVHELTITAPHIVRRGFEAVVHRLDRGEPFAIALRALPDQLGAGMVGLADVVASADRYGLALAPVLESLALEARSARRRSDEADARRLPVRLAFPLVTCTLPSFVLLAIAPAIVAALSSLDLTL